VPDLPKLGFHGGHSVKRANATINSSGSEVVSKMFDKANALGIKVQTRTKMVRFLVKQRWARRRHRGAEGL